MLRKIQVLAHYGGRTEDLRACLDLLAQGKLLPLVQRKHIDDLGKVIEEQHSGDFLGRVVLTFN